MDSKGGADKEQYGGASSNVFCYSLTVQSSLTSPASHLRQIASSST